MVLVVKNPPASEGDLRDLGSIPGSGRSPREGKWRPSPAFLPGEFHGQRSLWATIHGVTKSQTRLKQLRTHVIVPGQGILWTILHQGDTDTP